MRYLESAATRLLRLIFDPGTFFGKSHDVLRHVGLYVWGSCCEGNYGLFRSIRSP